ncbi:MAG: hypothetical protein WC491_06895 [Candidatus Omnitrophota bacterium]
MVLAVIAALHIAASAYYAPNIFQSEPGAGVFGGIRLHYLNPFNFDFSKGEAAADGTSHILDNFVKSAVSGTHGMLDFLHWYLYIAVYSLLGIPLSESWFIFAQAVVMAAALVTLSLLFAKLYDSKPAALVFIFIAAQLFVNQSRSFYIIPANTLMEGLLLWALYIYAKKGESFLLVAALFLLLFVNAASGNIVKLPLYMLFIWCVSYKYHGLGPARFIRETIIKKPSNLIFAVPVILALAGHFYVFSRLGQSHLGMFGWIMQKFGVSGAASRFSMLGEVFRKIFSFDAGDIWTAGLLFAFYVIAAVRSGRRAPLFFFPLVYYAYIINTEPNSAILPFTMILSLGVYGIFLFAGSVTGQRAKTAGMVLSVILVSYILIRFTSLTACELGARREPPPNYLKAAGYFLREHMKPEDRIASLLAGTQNILNEYYYGKNFFKSPVFGKYVYDLRNLTEPESASNPVSAAERKADLAFYVVSCSSYSTDKAYASFVDSSVKAHSLNKVADITAGGVTYISVYSARPIKYEKVDIAQACAGFDRKYANIKTLFANRHVGVASTWGYY